MPVATVTPVTPASSNDSTSLISKKAPRARPLFDPPIVEAGDRRLVR